jgi:hypothetical protein
MSVRGYDLKKSAASLVWQQTCAARGHAGRRSASFIRFRMCIQLVNILCFIRHFLPIIYLLTGLLFRDKLWRTPEKSRTVNAPIWGDRKTQGPQRGRTPGLGKERRAARETCPVLLAIAGREPSDRPAVRRDGATDSGSHDPSRVEPQVVAMRKSIPGKTPKEAVSEKSGSGSGDGGLRGFLDGRFGADHPCGEKMSPVECKWVYIFNRQMVKKLIPVPILPAPSQALPNRGEKSARPFLTSGGCTSCTE